MKEFEKSFLKSFTSVFQV